MSLIFDDESAINTYIAKEGNPLPPGVQDFDSLVLLETDGLFGIMLDGEGVYVYDMEQTYPYDDLEEVFVYSEGAFPFPGLYHAGNIDLGGLFGALYTDPDSDQAFFIHASRSIFAVVYYFGLSQGRGVAGSFTESGSSQVAYADGTIFQYDEDSDEFLAIDQFPSELATGPMAAVDIDEDGVHEIVSHLGDTLTCFSALDFAPVWENSLDNGLVNNLKNIIVKIKVTMKFLS